MLNWLFPPKCMNCNNILPLKDLKPVHLCEVCSNEIVYVDNSKSECYAVMNYGSIAQNLIFNLKYWGHPEYATSLGTMMYDCIKDEPFFKHIDLLIPIPLHKSRLKKRGYNQAHLLSKQISHLSGIKEDSKILARIKSTEAQNTLNYEERMNNLKDSMQVQKPEAVRNKTILLIDDIYTTGATIQYCENELEKYNPKSIFRLALAIVSINSDLET